MESAEVMHVYRCAGCGNRFKTEAFASRCPECRCKVLIHEEGERRSGKKCAKCASGGCSTCGGCSH